MVNPIIAPSILAGDYGNFAHSCKCMVDHGPDWLHVDVMDGHFVPNISFGPDVIRRLRDTVKKEDIFFDCHMMVSNPQQWVEPIAKAGGDQYTFHFESTDDVVGTIKLIREHGMRVGLAIKPGTPAEAVLPYRDMVDMILVMTVEPGFGGQKFMADMLPKVGIIRAAAKDLDVQVDGGLGPQNVGQAAEAGANVIVAGTSVFNADDPRKTIEELRKSVVTNNIYCH